MNTLKKIPHDIHVHTYLSSCCHQKDTQIPRIIIDSAESRGLGRIGFSDHLWMNPDLAPSSWYAPQNQDQVSKLREQLAAIDTPVTIMVGCEAETVAPGKFSVTPEFAASLDHVLLACSHFHMTGFVQQPESMTPRGVADHMLAFFISGVKSGLATAIAHPLLPLGYYPVYDYAVESISDQEFLDAFGVAAEEEVALEITLSFFPSKTDPQWNLDTPLRFLALAKQAGCKFTFGSDAHELAVLNKLDKLMVIVDKLGLTEDDVKVL